MNTYTYPAFEDMSNLNSICRVTDDGQVFYTPYMTGLTRITNIGEEFIHSLKDVTVRDIRKTRSGLLVAFSPLKIYWLRNDSIIQTSDLLGSFNTCAFNTKIKTILFSTYLNDTTYFYEISDLKIREIESVKSKLIGASFYAKNEIIYQEEKKGSVYLYSLVNKEIKLYDSICYPANIKNFNVKYFYSRDSVCCLLCDENGIFNEYIGNIHDLKPKETNVINSIYFKDVGLKIINSKKISVIGNSIPNPISVNLNPVSASLGLIRNQNYFFGTSNSPVRGFGYIKKYPNIYKNEESKNIFSVQEDMDGTIWAGSYNKIISSINNNSNSTFYVNTGIMNGGLALKEKLFFIKETTIFNTSLVAIEKDKKIAYLKNTPFITGFYLYHSRDNKIYFGTSQNGLWYSNTEDFYKCKPMWKKIDTNQTQMLVNILTITEDTLGRIWYAHPKYGIGIYYPSSNKTQYFIRTKNQISVGAMASITDERGTVWLGANPGGLWYYNEYKKDISVTSIRKINHPFFDIDCNITAFCISEGNLIINANDKTLVFNLDSFYYGKVNLKYLTTIESNYTSATEQNTLLLAKDKTIWFSTSDMLYQWDFTTWLDLPKEKIKVYAIIKNSGLTDTLNEIINFKIEPNANSIKIKLDYNSKDLLPRHFSTALQYENDSINWDKVNTNVIFTFNNLQAGNYIFHVRICELDGSLTYKQFRFYVDEFWYKKWWVISLVSLCILVGVLHLINLRSQKKLAEQKTKTQAAEYQNIINEQKNELAKLQAISISNQFRPHFLLNTLNAIGAYLYKQPNAEKLLSRIGEGINILFSQARSNNNIHSISKEFDLVNNVIEIFKVVYLKDLVVDLPNSKSLTEIMDIQVPFGLFQIPVENAMLHGLNNKVKGPYNLSIKIITDEYYIRFILVDNGIGRTKASKLSNARKHGTGLHNLYKIMEIYNQFNLQKIDMIFNDDVFDDDEASGTEITITIPKKYNYGN